MKDPKRDRLVRRTYRSLMRYEAKREEVRQEKKEFISAHFHAEPVFIFRPAVLVPALAVFAVFLVFQQVEKTAPEKLPIAKTVETEYIAKKLPEAEVMELSKDPSVDVKRASSRVGNVMVYQKTYQEVPVTIVWVFPTEGGGAIPS